MDNAEKNTGDKVELQKVYNFIISNKSIVLDQFVSYMEKVKALDILRLKLLNNQSVFKHELNLGTLSTIKYQNKIEILNQKLREQRLSRNSIDSQFITDVFGTISATLPPEFIISCLQKYFFSDLDTNRSY